MNPIILLNPADALSRADGASESLLGLMNNVCEKPEPRSFAPETPERLSEAGLSDSIVEQLIFKHLYFRD